MKVYDRTDGSEFTWVSESDECEPGPRLYPLESEYVPVPMNHCSYGHSISCEVRTSPFTSKPVCWMHYGVAMQAEACRLSAAGIEFNGPRPFPLWHDLPRAA